MNLWLPNAPYVEGVIPLYHVQRTTYWLCCALGSVVSSLPSLIHVWTAILRPKCSMFCITSYLKQPMITVWHNINAGRWLYMTLCNVQTHMLCTTLGPARFISLRYLFAIFYEANFLFIWFGFLFTFVGLLLAFLVVNISHVIVYSAFWTICSYL